MMEDKQSFLDLQVDEQASTQLTEASRWAKFLGIVVLIALGITVLMFGMLWNKLDELFSPYGEMDVESIRQTKIGLVFFLVIIVVVCGIMMSFLVRGANSIRAGIRRKDQALFNIGLGQFRNYLAMMGVLSVLLLLFSLIGFFVR
ncbi:MAG TPA: hypothetical protein VHN59_18795 [Chitinophagaceae bacterium]|nr:hypothetical protein [Chitinophagaceae bacterium]